MNKKVLQNIGAVIAGFLSVVILSTIIDMILEKSGVFPSFEYQMKNGSPTWVLITALIYRTAVTILGGYITARLSKDKPIRQVIILGILGTIAGIAGVIVGWNISEHWYPIALAVLGFPSVWIGGKLFKVKK